MLRVGDIVGLKVFRKKQTRKGEEKLAKLGKVHMAVFSPDGATVVGFTVKRPDIAGMVKRPDFFMARDSFGTTDNGLLLTDEKDGVDDRARERLGIDWDACIMWTGMDAKTSEGKELGYVNDAVFDPKTGKVQRFCVGDGGVAQSLVGSLEIPLDMVRGYSKGYMIVDPEAANLKLSGGAAAVAGEGYAKAKIAGKQTAKKAGAVASDAIDKGSFALGKALGKAKRAIKEAQADDDAEPQEQLPAREAPNVQVSAPKATARIAGEKNEASKPEPRTYVPASQAKRAAGASGQAKPAPKAKPRPAAKGTTRPARPKGKPAPKSGSEQAAKAVGRELGKMGSMFGSFMDEYKKASK